MEKTLHHITEAETINQRLLDMYGRNPVVDKPTFRVVWSEDQLEKQDKEHEDYTESGIFIRRVREVRQVKKYNYLEPCWVFERLVPNFHKQVIEGNWTYEPIWAFTPDSPELSWWAIEMLIFFLMNPVPGALPKNQKECDYMEGKAIEAKKKELKDTLDGMFSPNEDKIVSGDGVSFSGLDGRPSSLPGGSESVN